MSNVLGNLKAVDSSKIKGETNSLGGGRVMESGLYDMTIKMAYLDVSKSGANSLNLVLASANGESKHTLYFTNKQGLPYWERDGEQNFLPGYNQSNAICLLTVGKELAEMDTEKKIVKIYDFDAKKELPQERDALIDLIGEEITVGIIKQTVDKNALNKTTNKYEPTGDTREENEIDKIFRAGDGLTVVEIRAEETEAQFKKDWEAKWTGVTKNKAKGAAAGGATGSTAGAPKAGSLFGKK